MGFWGLGFGEGMWHLMVVERKEGGKCRRVEEGSRWEGAAKDCIFCSSQLWPLAEECISVHEIMWQMSDVDEKHWETNIGIVSFIWLNSKMQN
ncbi:hypothetical protein GOBAR_AA30687 [Gossypium barbadense]|uniref:Uncharacterized protein n=1 Tax=Gossypium barbadense TaxID=3634 RepID=A0A2P5WFY7_GOSBA|nr:hypothetical protein GOBAR_AA30687 [Gossypium barbadense]